MKKGGSKATRSGNAKDSVLGKSRACANKFFGATDGTTRRKNGVGAKLAKKLLKVQTISTNDAREDETRLIEHPQDCRTENDVGKEKSGGTWTWCSVF